MGKRGPKLGTKFKPRTKKAAYIDHQDVDHCHATGIIRGLLCSSCNNGLGRFKDSINLLENAIDYLKRAIPKEKAHAARKG